MGGGNIDLLTRTDHSSWLCGKGTVGFSFAVWRTDGGEVG